MLGTNVFYPSKIEDEIYDLMIDFTVGSDSYTEELVGVAIEYLGDHATEWRAGCTEYLDGTGGICYLSWIENGHLHMIDFEYRKESK